MTMEIDTGQENVATTRTPGTILDKHDPTSGLPAVKFARDNTFQQELRKRVDKFFKETGRRQRDCPQMYLKTAILFAAFAGAYVLLVFIANTWWQAFALAILLGLVTAAIGLNVQHDGGHKAYSNHAWVNKLMAMTLDLIGGSSYIWHHKHVLYHHTYVNITGEDTDIDLGPLARLTPHQKRYRLHRWQHVYIWPLYGLMAMKWQLFDDFKEVLTGRISNHLVSAAEGMESGRVPARESSLSSFGLWDSPPVSFPRNGAPILLCHRCRTGHDIERRISARPRRGGRGISDAGSTNLADGKRLGNSPGRNYGGLRAPQPRRRVALGRTKLSSGASPLAAHLPRQLRGTLRSGGASVS